MCVCHMFNKVLTYLLTCSTTVSLATRSDHFSFSFTFNFAFNPRDLFLRGYKKIKIIIIIITLEFLSDLGHKLSSFSGEERASSFLFQRLSVSLQCFNSVLLHDTFVIDDVPDHVMS